MEERKQYGLFTAVAMVVGICIGSGIFFKSDNVLIATGGNVLLGVVVFLLAAISIVFGGLCIGQLAARVDRPGGVVAYAEAFSGRKLACSIGWFHIFVYYPALIAVVTWAVGIYFCAMWNIPAAFEGEMAIGVGFLLVCYLYNALSARLGGMFQRWATVLKLVPLILLGAAGLVFGDPLNGLAHVDHSALTGRLWIAAVGPVAFSYDGWIVATSIGHEVRDAKRNLPRALILGPVFVLLMYLLYFVGITCYAGPEQVMVLGDRSVALVANGILGEMGAKLVLLFVLISVMGTVNGLVLGFIRMPYSMAIQGGMLPGSHWLAKEHAATHMPRNSARLALGLSLFWIFAHYLTHKYQLLQNSDVSEISIAVNYLLYIALYYQVFKMYRAGEIRGALRGICIPLFATIGSVFVLLGSMQDPQFVYYAAFGLAVIGAALLYAGRSGR